MDSFNTGTSYELISSDFEKLVGVLPQSQVNSLLAGVHRRRRMTSWISLIQPETNGLMLHSEKNILQSYFLELQLTY